MLLEIKRFQNKEDILTGSDSGMISSSMTSRDVGDVNDVTRPNFAEYAFNDPVQCQQCHGSFYSERIINKRKISPRKHQPSRNGDDHTEAV